MKYTRGVQLWLVQVRPTQPRSFSSPWDISSNGNWFPFQWKPKEVIKEVCWGSLKALQVSKGWLYNICLFLLQVRILYYQKTEGQASTLGCVPKKDYMVLALSFSCPSFSPSLVYTSEKRLLLFLPWFVHPKMQTGRHMAGNTCLRELQTFSEQGRTQ